MEESAIVCRNPQIVDLPVIVVALEARYSQHAGDVISGWLQYGLLMIDNDLKNDHQSDFLSLLTLAS